MADLQTINESANHKPSPDELDFHHKTIDLLMTHHIGTSGEPNLSLSKITELERYSQSLKSENLPALAKLTLEGNPSEKKATAVIFAEAAARNAENSSDSSSVKLVNQLTISRLGNPELAESEKDAHLNGYQKDFRKYFADAAGLVTSFAARAGLNNFVEKTNPKLYAAGMAAGYIVGGLVNNEVAGRSWYSSTGFIRNAVEFAGLQRGKDFLNAENKFGTLFATGYGLGAGFEGLDYLTGDKSWNDKSLNEINMSGIAGGIGLAAWVKSDLLASKITKTLTSPFVENQVSRSALPGLAVPMGLNVRNTYYNMQDYQNAWDSSTANTMVLQASAISPLKPSERSELVPNLTGTETPKANMDTDFLKIPRGNFSDAFKFSIAGKAASTDSAEINSSNIYEGLGMEQLRKVLGH